MRKENKFDNMPLATILALIIPALGTLGLIAIEARKLNMTLGELYSYGIHTNLLAIATIPNLAIFYLFLNKKMYNSTKGVILAVFLIVGYVLLVKTGVL